MVAKGVTVSRRSRKATSKADAAILAETEAKKFPSLGEIRSWLPKEVFAKSAALSMFYAVRDVSLTLAGMAFLFYAPRMGWLAGLPAPLALAATFAVQFATGFLMWCVFVVGHDCGHGTFSSDTVLNRVMGEFLHSVVLCVPFYPWMLSHRQHHMYHNHMKKDYSHMWVVEEDKDRMTAGLNASYYMRWAFPVLAWPIYLYGGQADGGHLIQYGRLWKDRGVSDRAHGYISGAVSAATMYALWKCLGSDVVRVYVMPWLVFSFFLFTVTYLQHHDEDTIVYGDKTWSFAKAAFETVDRTFGLGIDNFHHNITDGHVIHHLFFTKIPHYNLAQATRALRDGLDKNGYGGVYKYRDTRNFLTYIWSYVNEHFFFIPRRNVKP